MFKDNTQDEIKFILVAIFSLIIAFSIKMSLLTIILFIFCAFLIIRSLFGTWLNRRNKILKGICYCLLIFISVFFISEVYLVSNIVKNRVIQKNININGTETMIILGTQVTETEPSTYLKRRLDSAIPILLKNPRINVIVSGFKGKQDGNVEAVVMRDYLKRRGVNNSIYVEGNSKDTIENIKYSSIIIRENKLSNKIILVTNDFHMLRSDYIARLESIKDITHLRSDIKFDSFLYIKEFFSFNKVFLNYYILKLFNIRI